MIRRRASSEAMPPDPLTRPAPAGESAGRGPPSPEGEGSGFPQVWLRPEGCAAPRSCLPVGRSKGRQAASTNQLFGRGACLLRLL